MIMALLGLYKLMTYNGHFYSKIDHQHPIFYKLRIPYAEAKNLPLLKPIGCFIECCCKNWWSKLTIPAVWSDSSELVESLPIMARAIMGCSNKEQIEKMKNKHDDLPWGWVEGWEIEDFRQAYKLLKYELLPEEKVNSDIWELKGGRSKVVTLVKKLLGIKRLKPYNEKVKIIVIVHKLNDIEVQAFILCKESSNPHGPNMPIFEKYLRKALDLKREVKEISLKKRIILMNRYYL